MSSGYHVEPCAMNDTFGPHRTGVVFESRDSDMTKASDRFAAASNFVDWALFPEEPEECKELPEIDEPLSTVSWRYRPRTGNPPPIQLQRTAATFTSSNRIRLTGKTRKLRTKKAIEVAEGCGVKAKQIISVDASLDRSKDEIPIPRTPVPQRLPTPELSDIEQDEFLGCCIDPRITNVTETGGIAIESTQYQAFEIWYVKQTATA